MTVEAKQYKTQKTCKFNLAHQKGNGALGRSHHENGDDKMTKEARLTDSSRGDDLGQGRMR